MISFGEFPEELQVSILAELIYSRNFPSSLVRFSQADNTEKRIAQDNQLWQEAICFYFPFVKALPTNESTFADQYRKHALQLFKLFYEHVCIILKSEGLTFSDYIEFLLNPEHGIPAKQQGVLIGLCVAAGQQKAFTHNQLSQGKNYALLFSAALNNKPTFVNIFTDPVAPTTEFKRCALLIAAEYGFLTICAYLLSHALPALDRSTLCEAFLKTCANGHAKLAKVFLTQPIAHLITFSLAKALNSVCAKGYTEIAAELLKNAHLRANKRALSEAMTAAVNNEQAGPLQVLLQEGGLTRNIVLMIDLLKLSIEKKNKYMTALIVDRVEINFSIVVLSETITKAIDNADYDSAIAILKSRLAKIPAYARRKILYYAAEKGALSIVKYLLENDPATFNAQHIGQVLQSATCAQHLEVVNYIVDKHRGKVLTSDKQLVTPMPSVDDLTMQFAGVSLEEDSSRKENQCLYQFELVKQMKALQLSTPVKAQTLPDSPKVPFALK